MRAVWLTAAWVIAFSHLAIIVAVVIGGPLALRWPRLLRLHVAVVVAVGSVFVVGADCPLTTWQKDCLRSAGEVPYEGGFIEHYLLRPFTGPTMSAFEKAAVAAVWIVPTVVSYGLFWRRARSRRMPRPSKSLQPRSIIR